VFVVGCGRSGTTLVGELLAVHPDVVYLNEPRSLWAVDPRTKVWRPGPGQIVLTAADLTPALAGALRERFTEAVTAAGRRRLVEKTPINAFRIGYLDALCPDALFVHVLRDGRDVAASIATLAAAPGQRTRLTRGADRLRHRRPTPAGGLWYGVSDSKWQGLRSLAEAEGIEGVAGADDDMTVRGLLEWRLAVTFARRSLIELDRRRSVEVRYEDLAGDGRGTVARLLDAVSLDPADDVLDFADGHIRGGGHRRSPLRPSEALIAGDLLEELGYTER